MPALAALAVAATGCTSLLGVEDITGVGEGGADAVGPMDGSSGGVAPEGSTEAGPSDASTADMTVGDGSVQADADATVQAEDGDTGVAADTGTSDGNPCSQTAGTGAVAVLGCPCSTAAAFACSGNHSKV
ncbi:MAG: hypothetical protein ACREOE_05265, partial [Gemmatimonadales bacterium]